MWFSSGGLAVVAVINFTLLLFPLKVAAGVAPNVTQLPQQQETYIDFPLLFEATIDDLQNGLEQMHFTSVDLVKVRREKKETRAIFPGENKLQTDNSMQHRHIQRASGKSTPT